MRTASATKLKDRRAIDVSAEVQWLIFLCERGVAFVKHLTIRSRYHDKGMILGKTQYFLETVLKKEMFCSIKKV